MKCLNSIFCKFTLENPVKWSASNNIFIVQMNANRIKMMENEMFNKLFRSTSHLCAHWLWFPFGALLFMNLLYPHLNREFDVLFLWALPDNSKFAITSPVSFLVFDFISFFILSFFSRTMIIHMQSHRYTVWHSLVRWLNQIKLLQRNRERGRKRAKIMSKWSYVHKNTHKNSCIHKPNTERKEKKNTHTEIISI